MTIKLYYYYSDWEYKKFHLACSNVSNTDNSNIHRAVSVARAQLTTRPRNAVGRRGGNVTLACTGVNVTWVKGYTGETIVSKSRVIVNRKKYALWGHFSLVIKSLTADDAGTYKCVCTDFSDSTSVQVVVLSKPKVLC